MFLNKYLSTAGRVRYAGYYIALTSLAIALLFTFVIFPTLSSPFHLILDPDHYGHLGFGIWKTGSLSYYPDTQPTVGRGPLYPLFIASCLMVTNGWWPTSVQIAQCILFAITCLLMFWISKTLWGKRVAVLTSLICAFHPFVLWYTSRILKETLCIFLFTLIVTSILYLTLKPSILRSIILGIVLGISALCKQTFLLYLLFIPIFLVIMKNKKVKYSFITYVFISAIVIVLPWTIRNWTLTEKLIPVHARGGTVIFKSDIIAENYKKSPFSGDELLLQANEIATDLSQTNSNQFTRAERELLKDSTLLEQSLKRYNEDPSFIFKKMFYNALMFWTLGNNKQKSVIITLLQIPLLVLFILATIKTIREKDIFTVKGGIILFIWLYFIEHLLLFAFARYSVVLIPAMLTSIGILMPKSLEKEE